MELTTSPSVLSDARVRRAGWVALLAALLTVGLITYGSWVRASGSGLGCPDWPLCKGQVVPALERTTAIEFGHRVFAGVTIIVVFAGAALAFRARRADPALARLLAGAFLVFLVQAALGGATVLTELHGMVRLAHLATAMTALALLSLAVVRGLRVARSAVPGVRASSALLVLGIAVWALGGSIVGTGTSAGCPGLPLCDERTVSAMATSLHAGHRILAGILLVALAATGLRTRRAEARRLAVGLVHGGTTVAAAQVIVGVVAVANVLPAGLRVLHMGLATLLWWALVMTWAIATAPRPRT